VKHEKIVNVFSGVFNVEVVCRDMQVQLKLKRLYWVLLRENQLLC